VRTPNVFAGPYLDRAAHLRKDTAWVNAALADPDTLLVPLWQARNLIRRAERASTAAFVEAAHELRRTLPDGELVLLGRFRGRVVFAAEIVAESPPELLPGAAFEDLRTAGGFLPHDEAGLLACARALILWRQRHRYCGRCGAPTRAASAGHVMTCSEPSCAAEHFPRLDPAIIVLVTDGERALLGRQAAWPPGRYSTIAGFVEPGESLEDAVVLVAAVAVSLVAHDRVHGPRRSRRGAARRRGTRGRALVHARGDRDGDARPAAAAVGLVPAHRGLV